MADRNGLRLVGWVYGAMTAIVIAVALTVVVAHLNSPVEARASNLEFSELP